MLNKTPYHKILYTLLLGCTGFLCFGQGYFNRLYPYGPGTFNVIETRQGYGTIGAYKHDTLPRQSLIILEVDQNGDTLNVTLIDSTKGTFYIGLEGNLTKYPGGYAMAIQYTDTVLKDWLMLLDSNFRFKRFYRLPNAERRFMQNLIYQDGYFYITGHYFTNLYPDSLHRRVPLLLKVDTAGQVVGDYSYPSYNVQPNKVVNRSGHGMVPTADGGMFIAAYTLVDYLPGVDIKDSVDFLVIKVDSNGNREWEKKFGNPNFKEPTFRMLSYSDTSALAFCSYALARNLDIPDYNISYERRLYEIYNDGRPMKLLKSLGPRNRYHGELGAIRLNNGNICFYGLNRTYQMDLTKYPSVLLSYTFVLSPQLDSLNLQYHLTDNNWVGDYHYLYDVRPAADGGMIGGGYLRTSRSKLNGNLPGSHIWLLKMDSLGCTTAGCQNVGLGEYAAQKPKVWVYPNPATDLINVNLDFKTLSQGLRYFIYDIKGVPVQTGELYSATDVIKLRNLPQGQYVITFGSNEEIVHSEKMIIR